MQRWADSKETASSNMADINLHLLNMTTLLN